MKRRSTNEWYALFTEQASSGMTAAVFCRERGLNPQYFGKRRKQLLNDIDLPSEFRPFSK